MDYEKLLKKYMKLVLECEGTLFLQHASTRATSQHDVAFTREEIHALDDIGDEVIG